jgi:hypothetical protein
MLKKLCVDNWYIIHQFGGTSLNLRQVCKTLCDTIDRMYYEYKIQIRLMAKPKHIPAFIQNVCCPFWLYNQLKTTCKKVKLRTCEIYGDTIPYDNLPNFDEDGIWISIINIQKSIGYIGYFDRITNIYIDNIKNIIDTSIIMECVNLATLYYRLNDVSEIDVFKLYKLIKIRDIDISTKDVKFKYHGYALFEALQIYKIANIFISSDELEDMFEMNQIDMINMIIYSTNKCDMQLCKLACKYGYLQILVKILLRTYFDNTLDLIEIAMDNDHNNIAEFLCNHESHNTSQTARSSEFNPKKDIYKSQTEPDTIS